MLTKQLYNSITVQKPGWTDAGRQPLHQDMEARIALATWQVIDKFDDFNAERIQAFIEHYEGRDHHR